MADKSVSDILLRYQELLGPINPKVTAELAKFYVHLNDFFGYLVALPRIAWAD